MSSSVRWLRSVEQDKLTAAVVYFSGSVRPSFLMNKPPKQPVNEAACKQLEKSWFSGAPLEIEACLAELSEEERVGTTEELIGIEMEFLWKQWSREKLGRNSSEQEQAIPTSVEQYLQRFPQLNSFSLLERLVTAEIDCRLQVNDQVDPAPYRERFSDLAAESPLLRERLDSIPEQSDAKSERHTLMTPAPVQRSERTAHGRPPLAEGTLHGTGSGEDGEDSYIGQQVAGYKILNEVGRGGMGVVYKAFDTKLKRIVALKVLRNIVHSDASEIDRFLGEATAAAQMDHPNIISVYEIEKEQETPFVVLEFASGGDLTERIDGTPFSAEKATRLLVTLAEAIHAAHEKGIVHRDLKPANIVFTANDEVKITDFGLAKWLDEGSNLTKSGEMLGTPSYMAPEQIAGTSGMITARTDVYALGVIFYELLTGRPPFIASSSIDTVLHVIEDEPVPPNKLQSEIGQDLNTICLKCLEKQPEKRYASAAALAADLQAYLEDRPITARRPSPVERSRKWIRRHPAASGFVAVATITALALLFTGIQVTRRLQRERDKARRNEIMAMVGNRRAQDQRIVANLAREEAETEKENATKARNLAEAQKTEADRLRKQAQEKERLASRAAYVNSISQCQQDLQMSNFRGANARLREIVTDPSMAQHRQFEMDIIENCGEYLRKLFPGKRASRSPLERLAVHPNREIVVTGSRDGVVSLWDLERRQPLKVVSTEQLGAITAIEWVSGDTLLVCDNEHGAQLYKLEAGPDKPLQLTKEKTLFLGPVQAAAIHISGIETGNPQGRLALAIGVGTFPSPENRSELVILDLQTGRELERMSDEPPIQSLAYNQDGSQLALGTVVSLVLYAQTSEGWQRREIEVTDPTQYRRTWRVIESVLFVEQHDPPLVLSAGHDGKIRGWNLKTASQEFELIGHQSMIQSISLDTTTNRLASGSNDRSVIVWDLAKKKRYKVFDEHEKEVLQVKYHQQGRQLLSVAHDGQLIVRDFDLFRPTSDHEMNGNVIHAFSANSSQTYMMVVSRQHLGLWNIDGPVQPLEPVPDPPETPTGAVYSCVIALPGDGGWLVGDRAGYIHHLVRNEQNKLERKSPPRKSKNAWVRDLAMHPDGKRFVSVGFPHEGQAAVVELWNVGNLEATRLATFEHRLFAVAIDSSGQFVAYAGDTHQARKRSLFVYDLTSQQEKELDHDFPRAIFDLQFQPDTLALAAVGDSPRITLFKGNDWREKIYFHGHNYFLQSVAFTENGERLISSGIGGAIRIWDVQLGNPLLVLPVPSGDTGVLTLLLEKRKKIIAGRTVLHNWDYAAPVGAD